MTGNSNAITGKPPLNTAVRPVAVKPIKLSPPPLADDREAKNDTGLPNSQPNPTLFDAKGESLISKWAYPLKPSFFEHLDEVGPEKSKKEIETLISAAIRNEQVPENIAKGNTIGLTQMDRFQIMIKHLDDCIHLLDSQPNLDLAIALKWLDPLNPLTAYFLSVENADRGTEGKWFFPDRLATGADLNWLYSVLEQLDPTTATPEAIKLVETYIDLSTKFLKKSESTCSVQLQRSQEDKAISEFLEKYPNKYIYDKNTGKLTTKFNVTGAELAELTKIFPDQVDSQKLADFAENTNHSTRENVFKAKLSIAAFRSLLIKWGHPLPDDGYSSIEDMLIRAESGQKELSLFNKAADYADTFTDAKIDATFYIELKVVDGDYKILVWKTDMDTDTKKIKKGSNLLHTYTEAEALSTKEYDTSFFKSLFSRRNSDELRQKVWTNIILYHVQEAIDRGDFRKAVELVNHKTTRASLSLDLKQYFLARIALEELQTNGTLLYSSKPVSFSISNFNEKITTKNWYIVPYAQTLSVLARKLGEKPASDTLLKQLESSSVAKKSKGLRDDIQMIKLEFLMQDYDKSGDPKKKSELMSNALVKRMEKSEGLETLSSRVLFDGLAVMQMLHKDSEALEIVRVLKHRVEADPKKDKLSTKALKLLDSELNIKFRQYGDLLKQAAEHGLNEEEKSRKTILQEEIITLCTKVVEYHEKKINTKLNMSLGDRIRYLNANKIGGELAEGTRDQISAMAYYKRAVDAYQALPEDSKKTVPGVQKLGFGAITNLAFIHMSRHNYTLALTLLEQSKEILSSISDTDPDIDKKAEALKNTLARAEIKLSLNNPAECLKLLPSGISQDVRKELVSECKHLFPLAHGNDDAIIDSFVRELSVLDGTPESLMPFSRGVHLLATLNKYHLLRGRAFLGLDKVADAKKEFEQIKNDPYLSNFWARLSLLDYYAESRDQDAFNTTVDELHKIADTNLSRQQEGSIQLALAGIPLMATTFEPSIINRAKQYEQTVEACNTLISKTDPKTDYARYQDTHVLLARAQIALNVPAKDFEKTLSAIRQYFTATTQDKYIVEADILETQFYGSSEHANYHRVLEVTEKLLRRDDISDSQREDIQISSLYAKLNLLALDDLKLMMNNTKDPVHPVVGKNSLTYQLNYTLFRLLFSQKTAVTDQDFLELEQTATAFQNVLKSKGISNNKTIKSNFLENLKNEVELILATPSLGRAEILISKGQHEESLRLLSNSKDTNKLQEKLISECHRYFPKFKGTDAEVVELFLTTLSVLDGSSGSLKLYRKGVNILSAINKHHLLLGQAYLGLNRVDEAKKEFQQIKQDPNATSFWAQLSLLDYYKETRNQADFNLTATTMHDIAKTNIVSLQKGAIVLTLAGIPLMAAEFESSMANKTSLYTQTIEECEHLSATLDPKTDYDLYQNTNILLARAQITLGVPTADFEKTLATIRKQVPANTQDKYSIEADILETQYYDNADHPNYSEVLTIANGLLLSKDLSVLQRENLRISILYAKLNLLEFKDLQAVVADEKNSLNIQNSDSASYMLKYNLFRLHFSQKMAISGKDYELLIKNADNFMATIKSEAPLKDKTVKADLLRNLENDVEMVLATSLSNLYKYSEAKEHFKSLITAHSNNPLSKDYVDSVSGYINCRIQLDEPSPDTEAELDKFLDNSSLKDLNPILLKDEAHLTGSDKSVIYIARQKTKLKMNIHYKNGNEAETLKYTSLFLTLKPTDIDAAEAHLMRADMLLVSKNRVKAGTDLSFAINLLVQYLDENSTNRLPLYIKLHVLRLTVRIADEEAPQNTSYSETTIQSFLKENRADLEPSDALAILDLYIGHLLKTQQDNLLDTVLNRLIAKPNPSPTSNSLYNEHISQMIDSLTASKTSLSAKDQKELTHLTGRIRGLLYLTRVRAFAAGRLYDDAKAIINIFAETPAENYPPSFKENILSQMNDLIPDYIRKEPRGFEPSRLQTRVSAAGQGGVSIGPNEAASIAPNNQSELALTLPAHENYAKLEKMIQLSGGNKPETLVLSAKFWNHYQSTLADVSRLELGKNGLTAYDDNGKLVPDMNKTGLSEAYIQWIKELAYMKLSLGGKIASTYASLGDKTLDQAGQLRMTEEINLALSRYFEESGTYVQFDFAYRPIDKKFVGVTISDNATYMITDKGYIESIGLAGSQKLNNKLEVQSYARLDKPHTATDKDKATAELALLYREYDGKTRLFLTHEQFIGAGNTPDSDKDVVGIRRTKNINDDFALYFEAKHIETHPIQGAADISGGARFSVGAAQDYDSIVADEGLFIWAPKGRDVDPSTLLGIQAEIRFEKNLGELLVNSLAVSKDTIESQLNETELKQLIDKKILNISKETYIFTDEASFEKSCLNLQDPTLQLKVKTIYYHSKFVDLLSKLGIPSDKIETFTKTFDDLIEAQEGQASDIEKIRFLDNLQHKLSKDITLYVQAGLQALSRPVAGRSYIISAEVGARFGRYFNGTEINAGLGVGISNLMSNPFPSPSLFAGKKTELADNEQQTLEASASLFKIFIEGFRTKQFNNGFGVQYGTRLGVAYKTEDQRETYDFAISLTQGVVVSSETNSFGGTVTRISIPLWLLPFAPILLPFFIENRIKPGTYEILKDGTLLAYNGDETDPKYQLWMPDIKDPFYAQINNQLAPIIQSLKEQHGVETFYKAEEFKTSYFHATREELEVLVDVYKEINENSSLFPNLAEIFLGSGLTGYTDNTLTISFQDIKRLNDIRNSKNKNANSTEPISKFVQDLAAKRKTVIETGSFDKNIQDRLDALQGKNQQGMKVHVSEQMKHELLENINKQLELVQLLDLLITLRSKYPIINQLELTFTSPLLVDSISLTDNILGFPIGYLSKILNEEETGSLRKRLIDEKETLNKNEANSIRAKLLESDSIREELIEKFKQFDSFQPASVTRLAKQVRTNIQVNPNIQTTSQGDQELEIRLQRGSQAQNVTLIYHPNEQDTKNRLEFSFIDVQGSRTTLHRAELKSYDSWICAPLEKLMAGGNKTNIPPILARLLESALKAVMPTPIAPTGASVPPAGEKTK